jgi:signal transduction histidine kinase
VLVVAGAFALAYGFAAAAVARESGAVTTYAGRSIGAAWFFAAAGLGLIAAGSATLRRRTRLGVLSLVAGLLWFAPIWEGWEGGPALARSVGMLAAGLVFPVLVHLVLASTGRPMSRPTIVLVASTYLLIGSCAVIVALVRDPYLDPYCWANCTTNTFDVASRPELARQVVEVQWWITGAAAAVLIATCVAQMGKAFGSSGPRRYWGLLPGGALLGAATVAYGVLLRRQPLEDPSAAGYVTVFFVRSAAGILIAAGLAVTLLQTRRQRRSVARIAVTLDQAPPIGGLDQALARAVGDPTLRVAFWLPTAGRYADAHGRPVPDPAADLSGTVTPLVRDGQTVAVVTHHTDPTELERALGSAIRLALDNERLQAEVRARMNDLAESRARIVDAADERRRTIERDLHDGAQQSLLGLSYDLRLARSKVAANGDSDLAALIDSAIDELHDAFCELRDLAHGIFPAVLDAAGVGPSVQSLADTAHISVDVDCPSDERYPDNVETAAYMVVAAGIGTAVTCAAHNAHVRVQRRSDTLMVEIAHDGAGNTLDLIHVADRVGACGGHLAVAPNFISAEIPCVS